MEGGEENVREAGEREKAGGLAGGRGGGHETRRKEGGKSGGKDERERLVWFGRWCSLALPPPPPPEDFRCNMLTCMNI